jgi:hypothetical protein
MGFILGTGCLIDLSIGMPSPSITIFFVAIYIIWFGSIVWSYYKLETEDSQRIADHMRKDEKMSRNNDPVRDHINIVASDGSMVLVGSQAGDLIITIAGKDHELKEDMAKISAAVEASGNKDAADSWNDFLEEAAGKKRKSKLKAFWDRTVSLAPDIATLTAAVAKIASLTL